MTNEEYDKLNIPMEVKEKSEVQAFFDKYGGLFSFDGSFQHTNFMEHEIRLKPGAKPMK